MDLEVQDHILTYQLPVAVRRHDVSLIVIDSITANFRAEQPASEVAGLSARSGELARLGQLLRTLAAREGVAVVVANQVSDRFDESTGGNLSSVGQGPGTGTASPRRPVLRNAAAAAPGGDIPSSSPALPSSPYIPDDDLPPGTPGRSDILSLLHQQRFFTGWGDLLPQRESNTWRHGQGPGLKTPALGLVWSTQIACRIALKKEACRASSCSGHGNENGNGNADIESQPTPIPTPTQGTERNKGYPPPEASRVIRRTLKLVMAPWTAGVVETDGGGDERVRDEIDFEIGKGGLQSLPIPSI